MSHKGTRLIDELQTTHFRDINGVSDTLESYSVTYDTPQTIFQTVFWENGIAYKKLNEKPLAPPSLLLPTPFHET